MARTGPGVGKDSDMTEAPTPSIHSARITTGRGRARRRVARLRRTERGAALVELAAVVPFMLLLVMGAVDYGTVYNDSISLRTGVREGARQVAQGQFGGSGSCQLAATPPSTPAGTNAKELACLVKRRADFDSTDLRVKIRFVETTDPTTTGYDTTDSVMVCAMRKGRSLTGFFGPFLNSSAQKSRLTMMALTTDPDGLVEFEEPALGGHDWSFCDPSQPSPQ